MAKKPGKKGDPLIGATIDRRWRVIDQLGAGGMGVVYRAERLHLGKQVALKFLHQAVAESKSAVARFEREAKAISRLHHVHCISILDFGVYRRQPYIVMEFVQGRQLTELAPESLTPKRAVVLMRQVLLGLSHAHSRGVIHRDLKLSNIMLVEMTGTEDLVKILDFGLARVSGFNEELSMEGMLAGTPSYMSPEQALGKKTDLRTDIYSAGMMLYVLSTGKRPFVASDTKHLLYLQVHEPPPQPRKIAPAKRISDALERVILRALEKKPTDRFQNVGEFLQALDETPEGQETLTPTVLRDRPRRRWRLLGIAAAACIALGAAGALWARSYVLRIRTEAVGAYERWTGPEPSAAPAPAATPPPASPPTVAPTPEPRSPPPATASKVVGSEEHAELPYPPAPPLEKAASPPEKAAPPPEKAAPAKDAPPPDKPAAAPARDAPPPPAPHPTPPAASPAPRVRPTPSAAKAAHGPIDELIADGKLAQAKTQLRDRIAVDPDDAWAHLMLGNLYAVPYHYRRDAFREWDTALGREAGLKGDATFRKNLCEAVDTREQTQAQAFLRGHFGTDESVGLLAACIHGAVEPDPIENAARLIEALSGPDRPELGLAAMRMLDVGKTCAQKKAAVETIGRLHYLRARGALVKLDRQRLAQKGHEPPALACFGSAISDAIEQLK